MSVSGISSSVSSDPFSIERQRQQSFRSLISSVRSGDLAGAQGALAALQQNSGAQASTTQGGPDGARRAAFQALTGAVASGDIGAAQSALSTWQSASSTNTQGASSSKAGRDQFTSEFASILQAVQNGDIGSAQQALTTLQKDVPPLYTPASAPSPSSPSSPAASSSSSSSSASPLSVDVQALFTAIQSGDADGAKTALDKLKADAAAAQPAKHGHHHHHGGAVESAPPTVTAPSDVPPVPTTPGLAANVTGTG
jgi:soluble cytochrome b562